MLLDDLRVPLTEKEIDRRRMLGLLGSGALITATAGSALVTVKYLEPRVLFEEETRFSLGRPEAIAPGTVLALPKKKVYVVHGNDGFYAMSSICTHLGCMTRFDAAARGFACPCHGSRFTLEGQVKEGPAPRPLPRVELSLDRGALVVDTSKRVAPNALLKVIT
jgi:cytochrome b6-f complex iron-sulfur subunit